MGTSTEHRATVDALATVAVFFPAGIWLSRSTTAEGWLPALAAGAAVTTLLATSILRRKPRTSTPADRITLFRAILVGCCVAVIVSGLAAAKEPGWLLIILGMTAYLLDAVDGRIARYTGMASPDGAKLDMEVDAALLLVLSSAAVGTLGWWVLAIGLMRYVFVAASWLRPALRQPLQPSNARRFIGAFQALALLLALAPGMPLPLGTTAVVLALMLLTASFTRDISTMERNYHQHPDGAKLLAP